MTDEPRDDNGYIDLRKEVDGFFVLSVGIDRDVEPLVVMRLAPPELTQLVGQMQNMHAAHHGGHI